MACSPLDLPDTKILQFEKEEERIFQAVERFPVDVRIEDSGSVNGLRDTLYEADGCDVVHITGHAGVDHKLGPVFYMENDIGELEKITPSALWESLKDFPPHLLFLSGCSTGKSDKVNPSESFAQSMVEKGLPIVLGWGLPVSDIGATAFAAEVYRYLSMGKDIYEAIQRARQAVRDSYHPWPLLRLFTDGSKPAPLIAAGQSLRSKTIRQTTHKHLSDSQVQVLSNGFVGRRREIQNGVRTLKGLREHSGLLIRGPAGVGKSCLAGKLIERFPEKDLIAIHGKLKKAEIVQKLRKRFDQRGISSGLEVLQSDLEFGDKIKELFRSTFTDYPLLLLLDDFEQNLIREADEYHADPDCAEIITPFLSALGWDDSQASLIVTSRYPFVLEVDGENIASTVLEDVTLTSFRGPDLEKKKNELKFISDSSHTSLFLEFSKGNPRLLEWLEQIAAEEEKYDLDALRQVLQGKNEEYVREYLADLMAKTEGEDFQRFLQQAAIFRKPVGQSAFETFGNQELLEKGVNLTLIERDQTRQQHPTYWVAPIIRESQQEKLSDTEKSDMHLLAYAWYDEKISKDEQPNYESIEEAVYHALESENVRGACKHVVPLGEYFDELLLYQEGLLSRQQIADKITDEIIEDAIKAEDDNVPVFLNNLGSAWSNLGDNQKAIEFYTKALDIDLAVYGDQHPDVAIDYNNLGSAWSELGDNQKAIEFYTKALDIGLAVYGDQHPAVATRYNNLGSAWSNLGDNQKAIEFYTKALDIDLTVYGDQHPAVATRYNNLGLAWSELGDNQKAIEFYTKALDIGLAVYGDQHPAVATRYNNLGFAWSRLGDNQKAIEFYTKALDIDLAVYGDQHPDVAIDYNNLGSAWSELGDNQKPLSFIPKPWTLAWPSMAISILMWPSGITIWAQPGVSSATTRKPLSFIPKPWTLAWPSMAISILMWLSIITIWEQPGVRSATTRKPLSFIPKPSRYSRRFMAVTTLPRRRSSRIGML